MGPPRPEAQSRLRVYVFVLFVCAVLLIFIENLTAAAYGRESPPEATPSAAESEGAAPEASMLEKVGNVEGSMLSIIGLGENVEVEEDNSTASVVDIEAYMAVLASRVDPKYTVPVSDVRREREASRLPAEQYDVTLITQCSEDRTSFLLAILDRWAGPVSAAVWLTTDDGEENVTATVHAHVESSNYGDRAIYIHFLQGQPGQPYPVNKLRNIAIQAVATSHFLVTDVDLWPSKTLYEVFLNLPTSYLAATNYAMVVPAFEISSNVHKTVGLAGVPDTFAGLQVCADMNICTVFKHKTDTHTSTWYRKWWQQTEAEGAYKVPCFDSIRYEPYLLVPKAEQTPLFDERFVGYGKNKIQFVQHLRLLGFQFFVLPQGFVIHVPHTYSKSRHAWSASNKAKKNQLFMSFMREKMSGARIRVPLCMQAFVQMSQDEYS